MVVYLRIPALLLPCLVHVGYQRHHTFADIKSGDVPGWDKKFDTAIAANYNVRHTMEHQNNAVTERAKPCPLQRRDTERRGFVLPGAAVAAGTDGLNQGTRWRIEVCRAVRRAQMQVSRGKRGVEN